MNDSAALRLTKWPKPISQPEFGYFRIYGFEGRWDDRVEEAVVLEMGTAEGRRPRWCASTPSA